MLDTHGIIGEQAARNLGRQSVVDGIPVGIIGDQGCRLPPARFYNHYGIISIETDLDNNSEEVSMARYCP